MTDLWLARHGATEWSRDDLFCGSSNIELSPEGREQATRLAARLAGERIDVIYASPLRRTVDTATAIGTQHGLTPILVPDLREMDFGAWEGRQREEIKANDGSRYRAWQADPGVITPEGGENAYTVAGRAATALAEIVARHPDGAVLIVAHRTLNRILLCHLLGLPVAAYRDRIAQDICAVNRCTIGRDGRAQLTLLNDIAHTRRDV